MRRSKSWRSPIKCRPPAENGGNIWRQRLHRLAAGGDVGGRGRGERLFAQNFLHARVAIARPGAACPLRKADGDTGAEAEAMLAAARHSGCVLMIGHNQRLAPMHVRAKQILQSGVLGRVISFRTSFAHPGPEGWSIEGAGGWFFQKEQAFVGAMGDLGVHKADLIRWLLAEEVVEVAAFVEAIAGKVNSTVDDNAICLFRMAGGAVGSMTVSWSHQPGEDNSTVLFCEKGIMRIGADPTLYGHRRIG